MDGWEWVVQYTGSMMMMMGEMRSTENRFNSKNSLSEPRVLLLSTKAISHLLFFGEEEEELKKFFKSDVRFIVVE